MLPENSFSNRNLLFISHANPEDNEFARWITLRLAAEGYPVFCEIVNFLGGEDPWRDVDKIIRQNTTKFLFVQSKTAMEKDGTRRELNLAYQIARNEGLKDFIIPLKVEPIPHFEVSVELQTTLSIEFSHGWAKGLHQLLEKLEQQKVEKNSDYSAELVNSWWRNSFSANAGLSNEPEELLSNWFEIDSLPEKLYFHVFQPGVRRALPEPLNGEIVFPHRLHGNGIISFAEAEQLTDNPNVFGDKFTFNVSDLLNNKHTSNFLDEQTARDTITDLLRQAWENVFKDRGLDSYELANKSKFCFFKKDQLEKDKIHFPGVNNKTTWRSIVGYQTVGKNRRYWHFGVSGKPVLRRTKYLAINPHVLFSDDGVDIWRDKDRMHKAKMSLTRSWWNPHWRDRILAVMNYLAGENPGILLRLGKEEETHVWVEKYPVSFVSPVSFSDPVNQRPSAEDSEDINDEENDFESDLDFEDDENDDDELEDL